MSENDTLYVKVVVSYEPTALDGVGSDGVYIQSREMCTKEIAALKQEASDYYCGPTPGFIKFETTRREAIKMWRRGYEWLKREKEELQTEGNRLYGIGQELCKENAALKREIVKHAEYDMDGNPINWCAALLTAEEQT